MSEQDGRAGLASLVRPFRHGGSALGAAGARLWQGLTRAVRALPALGSASERTPLTETADQGPHSTGPHSTGPHSTGPHSTGPHSTGPHSTGRRRAWWQLTGIPLVRATSRRGALLIATRVDQAAREGTPAAMNALARFLAWVRLGSAWTVQLDPPSGSPAGSSPAREGETAVASRRVSTVVLAMLENTRAPLTLPLWERLLTGEPDPAQAMRTLLACEAADATFGDLLERWIVHDFRYGIASASPFVLTEHEPLLTRFVERLQATPTAYAIAGEWIWSLAESFHPEGGVADTLQADFASVQDDFSSIFDDFATVFTIPPVPVLGTGSRPGRFSSVGQRGLERAQRRLERLRDQQAHRIARQRQSAAARQRRAAAGAREGLRVDHWGPIPAASSFTGNNFSTLGVLPLFHAALLLLLACPDVPRPLWQWIARYVDVLISQGPRGRTVLMPTHRIESLILALAFHPVAAQPRALRRGAQMWARWTDADKSDGADGGMDEALRRWWTLLDERAVGHETLLESLNQRTIERALRAWDRSLTLGGLKLLLLSGHRDVRATALRWVGILSPKGTSARSAEAPPSTSGV